MKQNNEEFSLKDLWGFIVPRLWMIVIVAIIGAVATFVYTQSHNVATYSVSTSLFVESSSDVNGVKNSNVSVSKQRVPLYMEIIESNRDFHEEIIKTMTAEEREAFGLSLEEDKLYDSLKRLDSMISTEVISTENSGELEMFHVHVSDSNKDCALRVAEIIKDLAILEQDEAKGIYNPVYKNIGLPSTMSCVDSPRFVGSTMRYSPVMNAAIGAFAGALIAVFALFFYSAIDGRVRNRKTLEKNFEIPILGVIPKVTFDAAPKKSSAMKSWKSWRSKGNES